MKNITKKQQIVRDNLTNEVRSMTDDKLIITHNKMTNFGDSNIDIVEGEINKRGLLAQID